MKINILFSVVICLLIFSCAVAPQEIHYEKDQCHACRMMISDPRFGAELVTIKGKVYKFDAIECMLPEVIKNGKEAYAFILATDFQQPGKLLDVKDLDFLINDQVPSPMGRNLSAYQLPDRKSIADSNWFDWSGLLMHFNH